MNIINVGVIFDLFLKKNLTDILFYLDFDKKMKNYDFKHVAYHVLVGLYFIWFTVFSVLLSMALNHTFAHGNPQLSKVYPVWICLNFIMGTSVFIVLRLFRNRKVLSKVINYSFYIVIIAAIATVFYIMS